MALRRWLVDRMVDHLTRPLPRYDRRGHNDVDSLKAHVRKGDVLLVEGDQRISAIIRYFTQSSWSHSALYIGDELTRRGGDMAVWAREQYADEADHLIVEALPRGVMAAPMVKYVDYNLRICRPHALRPEDRSVIMEEAIGTIGWQYDLRNVFDLMRYLLPFSLIPSRWRETALHFGSGEPTEVICSSLIGRLFQRVRFPIQPSVTYPEGHRLDGPPRRDRKPLLRSIFGSPSQEYTGIFRMRHPTLLTPRDFDLSPYFDIVKFNQLADGDFDYRRMRWAADTEAPPALPEIRAQAPEPGEDLESA